MGLLRQRFLSVGFNAGSGEMGILTSDLSFHKTFHSNNFVSKERRVHWSFCPRTSCL